MFLKDSLAHPVYHNMLLYVELICVLLMYVVV